MTCSATHSAMADNLVIVHTNDTHSQIDPNNKDLGGILRRQVLIDSIRACNPNTFVIDAGDAVQGTLYFNRFKGEVEYKMLDLLGYDMAIVGNHDFDNGSEALAGLLKQSKTPWISSNYNTTGALEGVFKPYITKTYGDKKVAFIGLNLRPKGMISEGCYDGVEYLDAIEAGNSLAWYLKNVEKADIVVAVTHLGYDGKPEPKDVDIAANSKNIDLIIGGHSHTLLNPKDTEKCRLKNAEGREILVAQAGKQGQNIGVITLDLDNKSTDYKLISVDKRLDNRINPELAAVLTPYRDGLKAMMEEPIAVSAVQLDTDKPELLNFISDFIAYQGEKLTGKPIDLALSNKGSLRSPLPKGKVTLGMVLMMQPFNNHIVVTELKGSDLTEAFDVMAYRGGDGISANGEATIENGRAKDIKIGGQPIDPEKTYRIATIDYLANGGDYMESLTRGKVIATSERVINEDLTDYLRHEMKGKKLNPSNKQRMHN